MKFQLPKLNYKYDEFEPFLDKKTMELHYSKHHATYTSNLNNAINNTELENFSIEKILVKGFTTLNIRNNSGGFYNHNLLWKTITPNKNKNKIKGKILNLINNSFLSFENFQEKFIEIAMKQFGSGWAWLCKKNDKLEICSSSNQDNPLMPNIGCGGYPILGIDVWEHAYYLKYQNKRLDYIKAFFKIINWEFISNELI